MKKNFFLFPYAAFQKKCLGKLNNVATSEGRTVLFVSHDMAAILSLCQRTVFLQSGHLVTDGPTDQVVQSYMQSFDTAYDTPLEDRLDRKGDMSVRIQSVKIENADIGKPIRPGSRLKINVHYTSDKPVRFPRLNIRIRDFRTHSNLIQLDTDIKAGLPEVLPPTGKIVCIIEDLYLTPGRCTTDIQFKRGMTTTDEIEHAAYFDVETGDVYGSGKLPLREEAFYLPKYEWTCKS